MFSKKITLKRLGTISLFVLPAAILFGVFRVFPLFKNIQLSFQVGAGYGLRNYQRVFSDPLLWSSTVRTLVFALSSTAIEMIIGFAFALILNQKFFGRRALRTIFLIPWVIPVSVMAVGWKFLLQHSYGPIPWIINWLGITETVPYFLVTPKMAFTSLIIADVWQTTPFCALLLLAGLQNIPSQLYEAASIDGAGGLQKFWRITLPLVVPSAIVALMFRFLRAFAIFSLPWVLTQGGPGGATTTLSIGIFRKAMRYLQLREGAAMAVVMVLYVIAILLAIALTRRKLGSYGGQA